MQTTSTSMNGRLALTLAMAIFFGTTAAHAEPPPATAKAPSTAAERQARGEAAAKAFVLGRYDEALSIYLDLYVQSDGRPEYLRNIGRCQQKLHQDDRAIESFREYLRQAKRLSADERREVQGFIAEIETARKNAAAPTPTPAPAPAPARAPPAANPATPPPPPAPTYQPVPAPAAPAYPPSSWPPPPGPSTDPNGTVPPQPPPDLTAPVPYGQPPPSAMPPLLTAPPPPAASSGSGLRTAGIVTVIAAAALAGAGTLELIHARSVYDDAKKSGCADGAGDSTCDQKADSVSTANLLSKILYGVAGAAAVTGTVFLVIAPSSDDSTRVGLTARFRF